MCDVIFFDLAFDWLALSKPLTNSIKGINESSSIGKIDFNRKDCFPDLIACFMISSKQQCTSFLNAASTMTFFCCSNRSDYKNQWWNTESTKMIKEFITFCDGDSLSLTSKAFAIQAVTKEDFGPTLSTEWYIREGTGFRKDPTKNSGGRFKRSNDYKNFKCRAHKRYFEINLYTEDGVSYHHESTRSGRSFARDPSIDQVSGSVCTKGAHWTHPSS